ncbi:hypothetical protein V1525DRAFT_409748 [Lipomyces kononenkoae]|uniref:Uncharacterized protein n=1 Tax=Lipomyces kononenkoae TaxID=34357 RepID=A0ACC3SV29_LIPKO
MSRHIKKHSGGPQAVDSSDESILKERRLRGKLAQKRYRDRTKQTIASLEKQNSRLESTINGMVRAFVDFHDTALGTSRPLSPKLAHALRQATVKFIECAKAAIDITEDDTATSSSVENAEQGYKTRKEITQTQSSRDKNATHEHITSFESSSPPAVQSLTSRDTPLLSSRVGQLDWNFDTRACFAHYLDYSVIEYALSCISLPRTRLSEILRIFKLSLSYHTPDQIIANLNLYRSTFDTRHAPLRHLGGAGLHYKSVEEFAIHCESLETSLAPRSLYENAKQIGIRPDMINDLSEFEGEWYDANDVEHYLRQRGIFIVEKSMNAVASLAQIRTSAIAPLDVVTTNITVPFSSGHSLSQSGAKPLNIPGYNQQGNSFYYSCDHFGFGSESTQKSSNSSTLHEQLPFDQSSSSSGSGYIPQVLLDLNLMIDVLKRTAVCLVRSPGFRKHDIDSALRASIVGFVNPA